MSGTTPTQTLVIDPQSPMVEPVPPAGAIDEGLVPLVREQVPLEYNHGEGVTSDE